MNKMSAGEGVGENEKGRGEMPAGISRGEILGYEIRDAGREARQGLSALRDFFSFFTGACAARKTADGGGRVLVLRTHRGTVEVPEAELGCTIEQWLEKMRVEQTATRGQ